MASSSSSSTGQPPTASATPSASSKPTIDEGHRFLQDGLSSINSIDELESFVRTIPHSNNRFGVMKVLQRLFAKLQLIGCMQAGLKPAPRKDLENLTTLAVALKCCSNERHLNVLKQAILNEQLDTSSASPTVDAGFVNSIAQNVNRIALMAHAVADTTNADDLHIVLNNVPRHQRIRTITNEGSGYIKDALARIVDKSNQKKEEYELSVDEDDSLHHLPHGFESIDPKRGHLDSPEQFYELWVKFKNAHDRLLHEVWNKIKNESGIAADRVAFECCQIIDKTLDLPLFYCYLAWRKKELRFISNTLSPTVGRALGYIITQQSLHDYEEEEAHEDEEASQSVEEAGSATTQSAKATKTASNKPPSKRQPAKRERSGEFVVASKVIATALQNPEETAKSVVLEQAKLEHLNATIAEVRAKAGLLAAETAGKTTENRTSAISSAIKEYKAILSDPMLVEQLGEENCEIIRKKLMDCLMSLKS